MSGTVPFQKEQAEARQKPVGVVNEPNQVEGLIELHELAGDKYAVLFLHNGDIKPVAGFFDQCNEYLDSVYHADFKIAWCSYAEFATKYGSEHKGDKLHFYMACKHSDSKFFAATDVKDFATIVKDAFHGDLALAPKHTSHSRIRCICCRKGMKPRRKINIAARNVAFKAMSSYYNTGGHEQPMKLPPTTTESPQPADNKDVQEQETK
ncbi:hypothetical protein GGF44_005120 [Coemansia sp. RSA 1694]|nr:hypothetical protein GGF44_005120 [Coemansia sp. RSA 1694]